MRASTAICALLISAWFCTACDAQRPAAKLQGIDLQELLQLQARAEAAQAGKGQLRPNDLSQALDIAKQLGLSPEDLAKQIRAQAGTQPGIRGLSEAEIAKHIRGFDASAQAATSRAVSSKRSSPKRKTSKRYYSRRQSMSGKSAQPLSAAAGGGSQDASLDAILRHASTGRTTTTPAAKSATRSTANRAAKSPEPISLAELQKLLQLRQRAASGNPPAAKP